MKGNDGETAVQRIRRSFSQELVIGGACKCRRITAKLGDTPGAALRAMRNYGLTDREIARYYGITPSTLRRLKRHFDIAG